MKEEQTDDTEEALPGPEALLEEDPNFLEVILRFLDRLPIQLTEIQEAQFRGDLVQLATHAHRVKGTAGSFGFPSLTEISESIEELATNNASSAQLLMLLEIFEKEVQIASASRERLIQLASTLVLK